MYAFKLGLDCFCIVTLFSNFLANVAEVLNGATFPLIIIVSMIRLSYGCITFRSKPGCWVLVRICFLGYKTLHFRNYLFKDESGHFGDSVFKEGCGKSFRCPRLLSCTGKLFHGKSHQVMTLFWHQLWHWLENELKCLGCLLGYNYMFLRSIE